jgi:hypothetical protein
VLLPEIRRLIKEEFGLAILDVKGNEGRFIISRDNISAYLNREMSKWKKDSASS